MSEIKEAARRANRHTKKSYATKEITNLPAFEVRYQTKIGLITGIIQRLTIRAFDLEDAKKRVKIIYPKATIL